MLLLPQVQKFYEVECATSPCAKDKMRKRLGPTIYQEAQAMYQMDTFKVCINYYMLIIMSPY